MIGDTSVILSPKELPLKGAERKGAELRWEPRVISVSGDGFCHPPHAVRYAEEYILTHHTVRYAEECRPGASPCCHGIPCHHHTSTKRTAGVVVARNVVPISETFPDSSDFDSEDYCSPPGKEKSSSGGAGGGSLCTTQTGISLVVCLSNLILFACFFVMYRRLPREKAYGTTSHGGKGAFLQKGASRGKLWDYFGGDVGEDASCYTWLSATIVEERSEDDAAGGENQRKDTANAKCGESETSSWKSVAEASVDREQNVERFMGTVASAREDEN